MDAQNCCQFEFRPDYDHGFTLIPFQAKLECSNGCVVLATFFVEEATGNTEQPPGPSLLQEWVRRNLKSYAPLFTRTLTAIPAELIPPESHISNIDMKIEGRLVAVDFKKDEAIFVLDSTSARKLEVFFTELTGREPSNELTEKLSELRVRMTMVDVIGEELLGFQDVVGGVFSTDGWHASVPHEDVEHESDIFSEAQAEWAILSQSLWGHGRRFSPTLLNLDANHDDWGSLQATVGDDSDNGQLQTSPEDGSKSPQTSGAALDVELLQERQSVEGATELLAKPQQDRSPKAGDKASPNPISPKVSYPDFCRGAPKAYGDLGYKKAVQIIRIPPTLPRVDPLSASTFILPGPLFPRNSWSGRETRKKSSNSSLTLTTNIPAFVVHGSVDGSEKGLTPPLCSEVSSTGSESEVTTPSNASSTHSHPYIYGAFPTRLLASDLRCSMGMEDEDLLEYGFDVEDEGEFARPQAKPEKGLNSTQVIIQGKMEAMLGCAESQGYVYRASRDGLDNHPISVRLRSISGDQSSMKEILSDRRCSLQTEDNTINAWRSQVVDHHFAALESPLLVQEAGETIRDGYSTSENYQSSIIGQGCFGSTTASTSSFDTPSLQPTPNLGQVQSNTRDFSEYKTGAKSTTDRLKELKLKLEGEGEQLLGAYHRTLRQIEILETEIQKCESGERSTLEKRTREMIEYLGYDESGFTQEVSTTSSTGTYVNDSMENIPIVNDLQNSVVTEGEGRVGSVTVIIDSDQSKADSKGPLKVRTKFCANSTDSKENSPCCQFGTMSKRAHLQESNVRCAHGMMQTVKPPPNLGSTDVSPAGGVNPWRSNYTVGGRRGKGMKGDQEDHVQWNSNAPYGGTSEGKKSHPYQLSYSSTGMSQYVEQQYFPIAYSQNPTIFSPGSWMQQIVDVNTTVTKKYFDKLTEYYKSTHGEATQQGGKASCDTVNSAAKENICTGYERNWQDPL